MTPQSSFMIVAPLARSRIAAMRTLLRTMNDGPGTANPRNALVPFARLDTLHFARFLVLDDETTGDLQLLYGIARPELPVYLAFLGDFDGAYDAFLDRLVDCAGPGLIEIFELCEGFSRADDLRSWMASHEQRPVAYYCNWAGRTVVQAKEEKTLRRAIGEYLDRHPKLRDEAPKAIHGTLHRFVREEEAAGRVRLTPPAPSSLSWMIGHVWSWIELIAVIVGGVITLPLTIIPSLLAAWKLRSLEQSEPEYAPRPDVAWQNALWSIEDYAVTNQFTAMGSIKPGLFRAALFRVAMWLIDLAARTIYTRGRLARVYTIHFARWVYLDGKQRALFASNYDGSLESYMDDFVNKVGFGLNAAFCAGIGYPRTEWLVLKGAKSEELFKNYLRRHNLPTDVWYNAHAGSTAHDLLRNSLIRDGVQKPSLSETEAAEWITLL